MKPLQIAQLQDEALSAYNRVPQSEAAPFLQAVMLGEIVLQLAKQNEHLEFITSCVDSIQSYLGAIANKGEK